MSKRFALAAVAVTASLAVPGLAQAKVCYRLSAPAAVAARVPARVEVTTVMLIWSGARVTGARPEILPATQRMELALQAPSGQWRTVRLYRVAGRPEMWRASARLFERGNWELSLLGWDYAPRLCAPIEIIRVG
jgi:hypothetical protein